MRNFNEVINVEPTIFGNYCVSAHNTFQADLTYENLSQKVIDKLRSDIINFLNNSADDFSIISIRENRERELGGVVVEVRNQQTNESLVGTFHVNNY